jgi:hypothetical protein
MHSGQGSSFSQATMMKLLATSVAPTSAMASQDQEDGLRFVWLIQAKIHCGTPLLPRGFCTELVLPPTATPHKDKP